MKLTRHLWMNLKTEIDIWFFFGFLVTFPFSIRKVITHYPIQGQFNEYSGIYLYLSDIFLILTLFSWIIILCNEYNLLSILKSASINKVKLWIKSCPQVTPKHFLAYLGLIMVLWSFLSLFWSESKSLSLFRSIKLLEFYLLAIFVAYRIVPRGTLLRDTFKLLIFGGIINSIIAIWQFIIQHSIGLTFLKESVLSSNMAGVAKIVIDGHKLIRAYGFFPHPNILGGFLLLSIILTIYYRQLFHPSQNVPRLPREPKLFHVEQFRVLWRGTLTNNLILAIQITALVLTFSKSAIIGMVITLIYINVPRGTFHKLNPLKLFHVEQFAKITLITFFAISILISFFPNISPIQNQSLEEREILLIVSRLPVKEMFHVEHFWAGGTIDHLRTLLIGIGQGQSVWNLRNLNIPDWQFQPIHNAFLLIWSELGLIGLFLFVLILWKLFHPSQNVPSQAQCSTPAPLISNVPRGTFGSYLGWNIQIELDTIFKGILLGLTFILLFDHYLWDIQQGQIMLWIAIGTVSGLILTNERNSVII